MNIIPRPFSVQKTQGVTIFSASTRIVCDNLLLESELRFLDFENGELNTLTFEICDCEYDYEVIVDGNVVVKSASNEGLFHGCMTLKQLIFDGYKDGVSHVANCIIKDKPRFEYRSFMIDLVRHFFDKEVILKVIDALALFKMNTLHLHISDNQGYRIESEAFPILNEKANVRRGTKGDNIPVGGYLSKADVKEIIDYASARHIDVIPEIDLPGHTLCFLVAMPERSCSKKQYELGQGFGVDYRILCAGHEDNYDFIDKLLQEVCALFPSPYFHIGGDEAPKDAWKSCKDCNALLKREGLRNFEELQGYFTNRVIDTLKKYGKTPIVWNEATYSGILDKSAVCQLWTSKKSGDSIKDEHSLSRKMIVSNTLPYYIDYPHGINSLKSTYDFEPLSIVEECKQNVIGVETPLWTELIGDSDKFFKHAFPRAIAVAEAGWSSDKKDYDDFENRLSHVLSLLDVYDIGYTTLNKVNPNPITALAQTIKYRAGMIDWNFVETLKNRRDAKSSPQGDK